jgi:hypothetical protein
MDMSFSIVHVEYPIFFRLFVLFILLYPWPIIVVALRGSRRATPLSSQLIHALAFPLSLALTVVWWGYNRLLTGLAVSGSTSQVIRAAGVAEAHAPLFVATVVGAVLSIVVFLSYRRRPERGHVMWSPLAVLPVIAVTTAAFGWWLVRTALHDLPFTFVWLGLITCLLATAWSLLGLFLRKATDISASAAAWFALANVFGAVSVWWFMELHRQVAMGLRAA